MTKSDVTVRDLLLTGVHWRDDSKHALHKMPVGHRWPYLVQVSGIWWRWCVNHRTWETGLTSSHDDE